MPETPAKVVPRTSPRSKKRSFDEADISRPVSSSASFGASEVSRFSTSRSSNLRINISSSSPRKSPLSPHVVRPSPASLVVSVAHSEYPPPRSLLPEPRPMQPICYQRTTSKAMIPTDSPPVREISFPCDADDDDENENETGAAGHCTQQPELPDYQTLYVRAQRSHHELQYRYDAAMEENRLLKRQLIEWQRRVYRRRTRRLSASCEAWSVPLGPPLNSIKASSSTAGPEESKEPAEL